MMDDLSKEMMKKWISEHKIHGEQPAVVNNEIKYYMRQAYEHAYNISYSLGFGRGQQKGERDGYKMGVEDGANATAANMPGPDAIPKDQWIDAKDSLPEINGVYEVCIVTILNGRVTQAELTKKDFVDGVWAVHHIVWKKMPNNSVVREVVAGLHPSQHITHWRQMVFPIDVGDTFTPQGVSDE
jgi:hypothetical protein